MTRYAALAALFALAAAPASAAAHTITGLVHDARTAVRAQPPGVEAGIAADGARIELRRADARVIEVLDPQGAPVLRLDARGQWARVDAPILTVLSVTTGARDPRDPSWSRIAGGTVLRFHYPGTHGETTRRWRVPLRVDGRAREITGTVERVATPPLAWVLAAGAAAVAGGAVALRLAAGRRAPHVLVGALALTVVALSHGESRATGGAPWGEIVAVAVAVAGLAVALRVRRDAALALGALAATAILLVLPLIGRLSLLRHGVIVTALDPDLARALVVAGLAAASGTVAAAARAWWPATAPGGGERRAP